MNEIRTDWTRDEVSEIYNLPLLELIYRAASLHRKYHDPSKVQLCDILSIKTGGCQEDCKYCSQSSTNRTMVVPEKMMDVDKVLERAKEAKASGCTRFCMGAAWRNIRDGKAFDSIIEMVEGVHEMGLEPCCTMGMVTKEQAVRLKKAGCYAYNHNLDTSESYYKEVTTTRKYSDRLETIQYVRDAGITVCCGGILGMGETHDDRIDLLHTLATLSYHPESVPINNLVPIPGTPLGDSKPATSWDFVRACATARILMPKAHVRFSAGRRAFSPEAQALCFLAGVNSIWNGRKLLTVANTEPNDDSTLFAELGLTGL